MSAADAEKTPYRTMDPAPEETPKGHPIGLYILFGTEMWERFSYYGMRALLVLYLIKVHGWQPQESSSVYKWYTSLVYLTPLLGGFLADRYLGLRTAIIIGGVLMAIGHFLMAFEPLPMFYMALAFLIAGNGFFKPNISTLVGKMYKKRDPRRDGAFTIFYMGINLGAFMAPLICGQWLRATYGFHYGFAAAGVGMMIGLMTFLVGQKWIRKAVAEAGNTMDRAPAEAETATDRDAAPPPPAAAEAVAPPLTATPDALAADDDEQRPAHGGVAGIVAKIMPFLMLTIAVVVPVRCIYLLATGHETLKGVFMPVAFSLIAGLMGFVLLSIKGAARDKSIVIFSLFFFVVLFWMAFEQAGNALNLWAEFFTQRTLVFFDMEAEAYQSINAIGIVILGPVFAWLWLRLARSGREPSTPLKMGIAMVFVALSFVAMVGAAVFEAQGETRVHLAKEAIPSSIDISKLNAGRMTYDDAKGDLVVRGVLASYVVNDALTKAAAPGYRASVEALVAETQGSNAGPYTGKLESVPEGADPSKLDVKLHARWENGSLTVSEPIDAPNKTTLLGLGAPREWREALQTLTKESDASRVTGFWLFLSYLLATIGELCLSPVGLSMVTKLAPARFASLFMGVWMLTSSVAQYAGGSIGESWGTITPSTYFNLFVLSSAIGAAVLFVLVHPLKRLMHNVN
jgi:proton-dependent oligopeptide transporter, POT family